MTRAPPRRRGINKSPGGAEWTGAWGPRNSLARSEVEAGPRGGPTFRGPSGRQSTTLSGRSCQVGALPRSLSRPCRSAPHARGAPRSGGRLGTAPGARARGGADRTWRGPQGHQAEQARRRRSAGVASGATGRAASWGPPWTLGTSTSGRDPPPVLGPGPARCAGAAPGRAARVRAGHQEGVGPPGLASSRASMDQSRAGASPTPGWRVRLHEGPRRRAGPAPSPSHTHTRSGLCAESTAPPVFRSSRPRARRRLTGVKGSALGPAPAPEAPPRVRSRSGCAAAGAARPAAWCGGCAGAPAVTAHAPSSGAPDGAPARNPRRRASERPPARPAASSRPSRTRDARRGRGRGRPSAATSSGGSSLPARRRPRSGTKSPAAPAPAPRRCAGPAAALPGPSLTSADGDRGGRRRASARRPVRCAPGSNAGELRGREPGRRTTPGADARELEQENVTGPGGGRCERSSAQADDESPLRATAVLEHAQRPRRLIDRGGRASRRPLRHAVGAAPGRGEQPRTSSRASAGSSSRATAVGQTLEVRSQGGPDAVERRQDRGASCARSASPRTRRAARPERPGSPLSSREGLGWRASAALPARGPARGTARTLVEPAVQLTTQVG